MSIKTNPMAVKLPLISAYIRVVDKGIERGSRWRDNAHRNGLKSDSRDSDYKYRRGRFFFGAAQTRCARQPRAHLPGRNAATLVRDAVRRHVRRAGAVP